MLGRLEYKYLVPISLINRIRDEITPYTLIDPFAIRMDRWEYVVRSVYYDSLSCDCYCQKVSGIRVRNKYRIRGYNTGNLHSPVYLEIKRKDNSFISKSRAQLILSQSLDILQNRSNGNGSDNQAMIPENARSFLYYYYTKNLNPTTLVVYDREAFYGRFNTNLRLTFDKNLRTFLLPDPERLFDDIGLCPVLKDSFIFEVKFYGTLPGWIRAIIIKYALPRMALSKYTNCLESCHFDMRAVNWMNSTNGNKNYPMHNYNKKVSAYAG